MLDGGKDFSYILNNTISSLQELGRPSVSLSVQAFGSSAVTTTTQVNVTFLNIYNEKKEDITLHITPHLSQQCQIHPTGKCS